MWKNYSQLLNVHNVSHVRQIEMHTAEPLVLAPICFEIQVVGVEGVCYCTNLQTKHLLLSHHQNAGGNRIIKIAN
jgi:hypothetical protein